MIKRKLFKNPKFFTTKIAVDKKNGRVKIEFPAAIFDYIKFVDKQAHWSIVNGVLQVSGNEPKTTIPILADDEAAFVSQEVN